MWEAWVGSPGWLRNLHILRAKRGRVLPSSPVGHGGLMSLTREIDMTTTKRQVHELRARTDETGGTECAKCGKQWPYLRMRLEFLNHKAQNCPGRMHIRSWDSLTRTAARSGSVTGAGSTLARSAGAA